LPLINERDAGYQAQMPYHSSIVGHFGYDGGGEAEPDNGRKESSDKRFLILFKSARRLLGSGELLTPAATHLMS